MEFEWDASRRRQVMEKHGIDILYAAQVFENPVLTKADKRMDYGQGRWISLGVIENECFIVVHTERKDVTRPIAAWEGGRLSTTNIKQASLEDIKKMTAVGKVLRPSTTPVGEELPDDFWADAVVVKPKAVKSVHLKIDAEVFDFFKRQGKRPSHPHAGRTESLRTGKEAVARRKHQHSTFRQAASMRIP